MKNRQSGFSLIELMIAVAIIGLLATLATPLFNSFVARAKQAEVKTNLTRIATLAEAYFIENGNYGTTALPTILTSDSDASGCSGEDYCNRPNALGFALPCSNRRYDYQYLRFGAGGFSAEAIERAPAPGRCAKARTVFPGCASLEDSWRLRNSGGLDNYYNALEDCI